MLSFVNRIKAFRRMPPLLAEIGNGAPASVEALIEAVFAATGELRFVQIGANDGRANDDLTAVLERGRIPEEKVSGLCLEPQREAFEALLRTHAGRSGVQCLNLALGPVEEERTLWNLAEERRGDRRRGDFGSRLGSFDRDLVLAQWRKLATPALRDLPPEAILVSEQVACVTFEGLARRTGLTSFDLLLIDAEGFDAEILRLIDLERWRPMAIVLEHKHLSAADKRWCFSLLKSAGYRIGGSSKDLWGRRPVA
ncbi:FkbM family methyltransferase [Albimonas pacifica]|uniref:Methyltransferase, FkbM family n=1 Tax=Albimonas pacifica TaxID=1114924 RepID=A0A1I3BRN2_9RHOB|nr:FkbM family methyltransferase [Albimonas pacifica]SFH64421.1 methyltransferase, FkbM family [Albimonas pacifica]